MPIERIANAADPRVALFRDISDADLLKRHGLFVAEGRLVARRAIEQQPHAVRSVLVNAAACRSLETAFALLPPGVPIYLCDAGDFPAITGFDIHRGCLALVTRPPALSIGDIVAPDRMASSGGHEGSATGEVGRQIVVVLEAVTNPDNVGGVFRNAAAFGAAGVLLDPASCDPLYRKSIRTSMAAVLRVPFARVDPWPAGLEILREQGFSIVALTPREPSVPIDALVTAHPPRMALLAGTEGEGLTPQAEAMADWCVRIPVAADVDSLNVAVAVGIALHRLA